MLPCRTLRIGKSSRITCYKPVQPCLRSSSTPIIKFGLEIHSQPTLAFANYRLLSTSLSLSTKKTENFDDRYFLEKDTIRQFCKDGELSRAISMVKELRTENVTLNEGFLLPIFKAAVERNDEERLKEIFEWTQFHKIRVTTAMFNEMISFQVLHRRREAVDVYLKLMHQNACQPDIRTFNMVLKLYGKLGETFNIKKQMEICKKYNIKFNLESYNILIDSFGKLGQFEEVVSLYNEMIENGINPDSKTFKLILNGYASVGRVEEMEDTWNKMIEADRDPDKIAYNIKLKGYSRGNQFDKVVSTFEEMVFRRLVPSDVTYITLFDACAACKKPEQVEELVRKFAKSGIKYTQNLFTSIVEAYAKNGNYFKAVEFLVRQGKEFEWDTKSVGAFIRSLPNELVHGNQKASYYYKQIIIALFGEHSAPIGEETKKMIKSFLEIMYSMLLFQHENEVLKKLGPEQIQTLNVQSSRQIKRVLTAWSVGAFAGTQQVLLQPPVVENPAVPSTTSSTVPARTKGRRRVGEEEAKVLTMLAMD